MSENECMSCNCAPVKYEAYTTIGQSVRTSMIYHGWKVSATADCVLLFNLTPVSTAAARIASAWLLLWPAKRTARLKTYFTLSFSMCNIYSAEDQHPTYLLLHFLACPLLLQYCRCKHCVHYRKLLSLHCLRRYEGRARSTLLRLPCFAFWVPVMLQAIVLKICIWVSLLICGSMRDAM